MAMADLRERPATAADYDIFARLFPDLATGEPVPGRARWEAEIMPFTFFLERDGEVVAYAYFTPLHEAGYVRQIVVTPGARGQHVGSALMRAIARRLRAAGCARWYLYVDPHNVPAIRLYTSCGMRMTHAATALRLGWDVLARLPREEGEIRARPADPSEDAAIEAAFGLPAGRISSVRESPGWVILRLVDPARTEDERLGVLCFHPAFPGSLPFRAARPALAFPLLSALRSQASPGQDHAQVTVEDDTPLKQALLDAGAHVQYDLVQMEGVLPASD